MDVFWAKISERLSKLSFPTGNKHGCITFIGETPKKGGGYGVMKVFWPGHDKSKTEKAHRMAYMLHHKLTYEDMEKIKINGKSTECSHLCHNKTCVNPSHIAIETHETNQGRITCNVDGICRSGNHSGPKCLL